MKRLGGEKAGRRYGFVIKGKSQDRNSVKGIQIQKESAWV